MKSRIKLLVVALWISVGVAGAGLASPQTALAINCQDAANATKPACAAKAGADATGTKKSNCGTDGKSDCGINDTIKTVINVLLFIIGAVSVIMIILGGLRYVLSNGEASQIAAAKNTILYAVIGLIVALLAYAIVGFVITQFTK